MKVLKQEGGMLMRYRVYCFSAVILMVSIFFCYPTNASDQLQAIEVAKIIANRKANEGRVGEMHFSLINSAKKVRERQALMVHSTTEVTERIAIFFEYPVSISETAFLSFNHKNKDNENWLYLPATERIRRLPASDRGDYFLGTDLTYGDIQDNFKFNLADWDFSLLEDSCAEFNDIPKLFGKAKSEKVKEETGYNSFTACVDVASAFPIWIEYTDKDSDPLKVVQVSQVDVIGGAHTAIEFSVKNLQTGHQTHVKFKNMRFVPSLDEELFEPDSLAYGVPYIND